MATPKMTGFIIALLLVSLIAGTFTSLIGGFSSRYSSVSNITYSNATLANYEKLDELNTQINEIKNQTESKIDPNAFDVIGGYLKGGYVALKVSLGSFGTFNSVAQEATIDLGIGDDAEFTTFTNNLRTVLISSVVVIIFMGILISILVKKDRL